MIHCQRCGENTEGKEINVICDTCLNTDEVANAKQRQSLRRYERELGYESGYKDGRELRLFTLAAFLFFGIAIGIAITTWF